MATDSKTAEATPPKGAFVRSATDFHKRVGGGADAAFPAESGRYRLYISYACPWAHRCLIVLRLKGLEDAIAVTVCAPEWDTNPNEPATYKGWPFSDEVDKEPHGFTHIDELYELAAPGFRASYGDRKPYYAVPVFFDTKTNTIVCNESSIIIDFLNTEFNAFAKNPDLDLNPSDLKEPQAAVDSWIYTDINNGVYRTGFARSQEAYDEALPKLFNALDRCAEILKTQRYLTGDRFTLSDIRLFVTLVRFDPVYYVHFKCSRYHIRDNEVLLNYLRDIYQHPVIKATVNFDHIKTHYYKSHPQTNPSRVIADSPDPIYLDVPHGRDSISS